MDFLCSTSPGCAHVTPIRELYASLDAPCHALQFHYLHVPPIRKASAAELFQIHDMQIALKS